MFIDFGDILVHVNQIVFMGKRDRYDEPSKTTEYMIEIKVADMPKSLTVTGTKEERDIAFEKIRRAIAIGGGHYAEGSGPDTEGPSETGEE